MSHLLCIGYVFMIQSLVNIVSGNVSHVMYWVRPLPSSKPDRPLADHLQVNTDYNDHQDYDKDNDNETDKNDNDHGNEDIVDYDEDDDDNDKNYIYDDTVA